MKDFIIFDVETTGLDPFQCAVVQIGAVRVSGGCMTDKFVSFVRPFGGCKVKKSALELHGIVDWDEAPSEERVLEGFAKFTGSPGEVVLGGWNVCFDVGFLKAMYSRVHRLYLYEYRLFDVQSLARFFYHLVDEGDHEPSLRRAYKRICGVKAGKVHDALEDACITAEIYLALRERLIVA